LLSTADQREREREREVGGGRPTGKVFTAHSHSRPSKSSGDCRGPGRPAPGCSAQELLSRESNTGNSCAQDPGSPVSRTSCVSSLGSGGGAGGGGVVVRATDALEYLWVDGGATVLTTGINQPLRHIGHPDSDNTE